MSAPDVVVVGAGAIGAACALELSLRGARVEVLERGGGWAAGCSAGNAGLIVPSHAKPLATPAALREGLRWLGRSQSPFSIRPHAALLPWLARFTLACIRSPSQTPGATRLIRVLAAESLQRWAEIVPEHLRRDGVLCVYESEQGLNGARLEADAYAAAGLRCEVLDRRAVDELEPSLRGPISGGVFYPDEAHGDPKELVAALGAAACAQGARLRTGVDVMRLHSDGVVSVRGEKIQSGHVVLAAGAATRSLAAHLPVIGASGCSVDLCDGLARPARPVFLHEARVVATPLAGRLRLAGLLELTTATEGDTKRVAGVLAAGRERLRPHGQLRMDAPWSGLRPIAPDGLPIVGELPRSPNVIIASAHAMLGLTLAPATGRLVADVLDGVKPPSELRPDRFHAIWRRLPKTEKEPHVIA